jgi:hypothetical protein
MAASTNYFQKCGNFHTAKKKKKVKENIGSSGIFYYIVENGKFQIHQFIQEACAKVAKVVLPYWPWKLPKKIIH